MDHFLDSSDWAQELFGACRLVQMATQMADHVGQSLNAACDGQEAAIEGGYRFLRNLRISIEAMTEPAFRITGVGGDWSMGRVREKSPVG